MKTDFWLRLSANGSVKTSKTKPSVAWNEVLMQLKIEVPDSVFKRPVLTANIKIDGELNHEFDVNEQKKIEQVLETLPNVHLLNVNVELPVKKEEVKEL